MIYYRQKMLLALLDALGGNVLATDFQKHLFIYTTLFERKKSYDFVPYKYGCYSFQAVADRQKLIEKGYLQDKDGWTLAKANLNYADSLNKGDDKRLQIFVDRFGAKRGRELIQYIYRIYPYYAINSEIAEKYLNEEELAQVKNSVPVKRRTSIFATIGYEGDSVESYINKLIENDIRMLVDVRKNPISRKYGFSQRTLSSLLNRLGIEYVHIPELGIDSSDRKQLNIQNDYDRLFDKYENTVLVDQKISLQKLYALHADKKRIAITCFEKDHCQCHRSRVADVIKAMSNGMVEPAHL